ncbi:LicD family protein [Psychrilyobacter atlanticus]|uniref:LicD family protein n=1 Tax=Psychrilyobacter atlanticus TaxID=271091 RepID=UPI000425738C|nr:LicD family protein [Psychrilyobacter atlanticus]
MLIELKSKFKKICFKLGISNLGKKIYLVLFSKCFENNLNKNFKKNGEEILRKLYNAFDEVGLKCWLDYGTLLGYVREKDFISHDLDIDVSTLLSNKGEELQIALENQGFKKVADLEIDNGKYGAEETYRYKGVDFDIFFYREHEGKYLTHGFTRKDNLTWDETEKKLGGLIVRELTFSLFELEKINFKGVQCYIPSNAEQHLEEHYGSGYIKPDDNYEAKKQNRKTLNKKIGKIKLNIK